MEVEFKFTRPSMIDYNHGFKIYPELCVDFYKPIFKDYFKQVFNVENIELNVYNLNYHGNKEGEFLKLEEKKITNDKITNDFKHTSLKSIMPYNCNYFITCTTEDTGRELFSFYIYGQNNCCGMMSTSKTQIHYDYLNRKLGRLLQYFKEDIAISNDVSCLTCTDIYYKTVWNEITQEEVDNLKPYLYNTKLLLNTGWVVSKLTYNRKSNNVVALFTKNIFEKIKEQEVSMKIKLEPEKLVKISNVSIGCDPELFLKNTETKKYIPSFYVMKGDKNNPTPITEEGHNIQCDNVMVEYGVPPTKLTEGSKKFVEHNLLVQDYLREKIAKPNGLELVIFPSALFDDEHIVSNKAKEFGCDPDYNVWKGGKPNIVGSSKDGLRTAGKIVCQAN